MSEVTPRPKKRRVWLTTRQIASAAIFGGLSFAWMALGLTFTLVPPVQVDLRHAFVRLAGFTAGPLALIPTAFLAGIMGSNPLVDIPGFIITALFWLLCVKPVWYLKGWKRYVLLLLWSWVDAWFFAPLYWLSVYDYILHALPMKETWLWVIGIGETTAYTFIRFVPAALGLAFATRLMIPAWNWKGKELLELPEEWPNLRRDLITIAVVGGATILVSIILWLVAPR